jgi:hypothetical protein
MATVKERTVPAADEGKESAQAMVDAVKRIQSAGQAVIAWAEEARDSSWEVERMAVTLASRTGMDVDAALATIRPLKGCLTRLAEGGEAIRRAAFAYEILMKSGFIEPILEANRSRHTTVGQGLGVNS